jgi:hypothetical protein
MKETCIARVHNVAKVVTFPVCFMNVINFKF